MPESREEASATGKPRVSVVVPVYNGEAYLRAALESALSQTLPPWEVLVFDNASTDRSVAIASELVGAENVHTSERNLGATRNFIRAADAATGDFVMWLGADDILSPRFLEVTTAGLEANPDAALCLTGIQFIDPEGRKLRTWSDEPLSEEAARVRLRSFLRRPRWTEFYSLYRREALRAAPPLSSEWGSDVMFTWWFLLRGPLAVVSEPLLSYREFPSKPPDVTAKSMDPDAKTEYWRNMRMWRRLWSMTRDPSLPADAGAAGRRELLRCWLHGSWWRHLLRDAGVRWPIIGRPMKTVDRWIRSLRGRAGEYA